jgi:hypothetical protein
MKVVCINNKDFEKQLTIDKVYDTDDIIHHDVGRYVFPFVFMINLNIKNI